MSRTINVVYERPQTPSVQFRAVQSPQWAVKLRTKKTGSAYPQNRKKLPKVRRHDISPVSRILSLTSNVFFFSFDFRFFYPPALTSNELCEGWNGIKSKRRLRSWASSLAKKSLKLLQYVELLCYRWEHLKLSEQCDGRRLKLQLS